MYEKYSVLMSLYIQEKPEFFKQSVESMLNQTIKPDEIVIVLDGPLTNELYLLVEEYEKLYPTIFNVVKLDKNVGLGKALNAGIKVCKNELIARMDTDDISLSTRCEEQLRKFQENPNLDVLGTQIDEFYEDPNELERSRIVPISHDQIIKFSKRRSPFNHPTVMYKKSVLMKINYADLNRRQDLDLFSRIINEGYITANLDKSYLLYRADRENLKRRKSFENCKSYIQVHYNIYKRGHCGMTDFIFVVASQLFFYLAPPSFVKYISDNVLRKNIERNF